MDSTTLSDQLASLFNPTPEDIAVALDDAPFGAEDALLVGREQNDDSALTTHDDAESSPTRDFDQPLPMKGDISLGIAYRGVKRSRKDLEIEEGFSIGIGSSPSESSESISTSEEQQESYDGGQVDESSEASEEQESDLISSSDDDDDDDDVQEDPHDEFAFLSEESEEEDIAGIQRNVVDSIRSAQEKELKKAQCTETQHGILERTMDYMILLHRIHTMSNRLPRPSVFPLFGSGLPARATKRQKKSAEEVASKQTQASARLRKLLGAFTTLQQRLVSQNRAVFNDETLWTIPIGSHDDDGDGDVPTFEQYQMFTHRMNPTLDQLVSSWNKKTQIASGKSFLQQSKFKSINVDTLTQIRRLLENKERLVKRSRIRRDKGRVIGAALDPATVKMYSNNVSELVDPEIFDDGDFFTYLLQKAYHVDTPGSTGAGASGTTTDVERARQLEAQHNHHRRKQYLRGEDKRKHINYEVRPKLVNFMSPAVITAPEYAEELFEGLLGRRPDVRK